MLWRVIAELSGKSEQRLSALYRRHGDAGDVAVDALPQPASTRNSSTPTSLTLTDVERTFREIAAARGPDAKSQLLRSLLQRAAPAEAKYIVRSLPARCESASRKASSRRRLHKPSLSAAVRLTRM